ncbi:MAG: DUF971 domain-containing protein [Alphaproteobacteria bacterium]
MSEPATPASSAVDAARTFGAPAWPTDIRVDRQDRRLHIAFDDGRSFVLPAELLRVESPSAEVKGHGPGQEVTVPGKRMVGLTGAEPVGYYAVRLIFDDGHSTGIFTWAYLYELGRDQAARWQRYLDRVERDGLSRDA